MLLKAQEAQISKIETFDYGMMNLEVEILPDSDQFDYDMQIKVRTQASKAKLERFFELISFQSKKLPDKFKPLPEKVSENALIVVSDFKHIKDGFFKVKCPYEPSGFFIGKLATVRDYIEDGPFEMTAYSNWTYKKLEEEGQFDENHFKTFNISDEKMDEYLSLMSVWWLVDGHSISSIRGELKDQKLEGLVEITFFSGDIFEALAVNGTLHGISRVFGLPRSTYKRHSVVIWPLGGSGARFRDFSRKLRS